MTNYSLRHLTDQVLRRDLHSSATRECGSTAWLVAHLAEFDQRKLYVPAGYASMFDYCVHELPLSEDAVFLRIRVARTARDFPALFAALADGRLHLSSVMRLRPYLNPESADDLLAAAAGKSNSELDQLLAERFPRPDVPARVEVVAVQASGLRQLVPEPVAAIAPDSVNDSDPGARITSRAPERFSVQYTIGKEAHDRLRQAEALLGHRIRRGDIGELVDRALKVFISHLQKRKFAATDRPRPSRRASRNPRYVPANVKRAVWERDGGQCTFVGESGRRCPARQALEFDHVQEVARGGRATVSGIRLLCRTHNQYEAERRFGVGFMERKRSEARQVAAVRRAAADARSGHTPSEHSASEATASACEVIPWLRALGFGAEEARRAASHCEDIADQPLESRVRRALTTLAPPSRRAAHAFEAG